jgi:glyoxylase-like metal-dependent hydrolase (beta-lactamase superfamily II)
MKLIYYPIYFFIFLLFLATVQAERNFTNIELKVTQVSGNIYMLEGINGFAGGNIGVSVGQDGILIVDDQFAEMSAKIEEALSNLNPGKLRFILNTHWHGDHTGGNANFSSDATIIAHNNVRKRLMTEQKNVFGESPAKPREAWPIITFDQSVTVHFNDEAINVLHYPNGHTDGDSVIYFTKSNVVHMGDHFFAGMYPFVDLDSGGNVLNFTENVGAILDALPKDVMIIPGHGQLSTKDDLVEYHQMLKDSIIFIQQNIKDGINLGSIQKQGLPEPIKIWEKGFIKEDIWIKLIYESIMKL